MIIQGDSHRSDTLVFEFIGKITSEEVKEIIPKIEAKKNELGHLNLVILIDTTSETFGAFIEEMKIGIHNWSTLKKIAIVSDQKKFKKFTYLDNLFTKFEEKYFDINHLNLAWEWLAQ